MEQYNILILLAAFFSVIILLIIPNIPFTNSQFITQSTDLNYINFSNGDYNGMVLYIDHNIFTAKDINFNESDSNIIVAFACASGQAIRDFNSGSGLYTCVTVGGTGIDTNAQTACGDAEYLRGDGTCQTITSGGVSDGNVYSIGIMSRDNNSFLLDVNTGVYRLISNQVVVDRNGLQINPVTGSELAPALTAVNWTLGTGWASVSDLNKNADGTGTAAPATPLTIVTGTTYKVVMTVAGWTTGKATWTLGGTTATRLINSNETITEFVKATNTTSIIITPTNTSRFRITALSVKQMNTGWIYPATNSTNALGIAQADGRPFVFFDTTNKRIGIDTGTPAVPLEIQQTTVGAQSDVLALTNFDTTVGAGVCTRFKTGAFSGGSVAKICGFIINVDTNTGTAYGNSAMTLQTRYAGSISTRFYLGPTGETYFGKITNSPPFPYRISQMTMANPADITLTGTTTTNNSKTIIGTGTSFRLELGLGDVICLSSAPSVCAYVTNIVNTGSAGINGDTNISVSSPLGDGTTQTILRKKSGFRIDSSMGTEQVPYPIFFIDYNGKTIIGNSNTTIGWLQVPTNQLLVIGDINASGANGNIFADQNISTSTKFIAKGFAGLDYNAHVLKDADLVLLSKTYCDLNYIGGILVASTC